MLSDAANDDIKKFYQKQTLVHHKMFTKKPVRHLEFANETLVEFLVLLAFLTQFAGQ